MTKGEWTEIEPDELLIEAATENRDTVREWALSVTKLAEQASFGEGLIESLYQSAVFLELLKAAEAFLALDRYMIDGGALPYGWAFFTNQPDTRKRKGQRK